MSSESTPLTARHFAYLAARTPGDDPFLRDLKHAARAAGLPEIWISPEQGSFLQILLRLARAREVVEVGTLGGYSAIVMARALPQDGLVRTIEVDPRHADFAESWIARSDVKDRIEVLRGNGRAVLPRLAGASADACFLDADKEGYSCYLSECRRILRPGGLLLADNALAFGELLAEPARPEVQAIRAFNDEVAACRDLHSVIVPLGDGCWVGVKLERSRPLA